VGAGIAPDELAEHATTMLELNATASLAPVELERWLVNGGLAVARDGLLVPTELGIELAEALKP
jgi:hypothetical protein